MALIRPDNSVPVPALLKRFALIYLPVVVALSVAILLSARFDDQMRMEKMEVHESNQVEAAKVVIARELATVDIDLHIIASLPLLRWYQDSGNPAYREELEKLFLVLARETRRYDQVRYLDASGQEVIRINYNGGKPAIVPREQLQNKFGRYYFNDTIKLNAGELFVSPLDLNIEQGSLEIPHKPMIRFGTPVFDSAGRKKGIILLNYFGDKLLQQFREKAGDDPEEHHHNHMLLNRDGYWLSSDRREDEWGFMLGKKERTFGHDFAEAWRAIAAAERGTLRTDQGLFTYATFYPLLPTQRSSTGAALAHAPSQQELEARDYYWKIVTFVPHAELSDAAYYNQPGGRIAIGGLYLLLALTAWIVASVTLIRKRTEQALRASEEKNRLLFENSRDALLTLAPPSWKFTGANRATLQLFGASSMAEFTALGPWDISPELQPDGRPSSEKAPEMIGIAMREGSHFFEWECQRLDGLPFAADILLTRMEVGEEVFLQATVRDISKQKKAEEALRAAHDDLAKKNGRLEMFQQVAVNREMRMIEMKDEVNGLLERLGEPRKYVEVDRFKKR